eukprot:TRINITY_DN25273_c0_g1_i2.p1 TRINITY_DN25273_c0_g1~~TRINITY_DN25273_c0_g1_i2.p1  ORF type:complete len:280 (-),score=68.63 TRINITY_DN25273_c0_g1_i2:127-966(-)
MAASQLDAVVQILPAGFPSALAVWFLVLALGCLAFVLSIKKFQKTGDAPLPAAPKPAASQGKSASEARVPASRRRKRRTGTKRRAPSAGPTATGASSEVETATDIELPPMTDDDSEEENVRGGFVSTLARIPSVAEAPPPPPPVLPAPRETRRDLPPPPVLPSAKSEAPRVLPPPPVATPPSPPKTEVAPPIEAPVVPAAAAQVLAGGDEEDQAKEVAEKVQDVCGGCQGEGCSWGCDACNTYSSMLLLAHRTMSLNIPDGTCLFVRRRLVSAADAPAT